MKLIYSFLFSLLTFVSVAQSNLTIFNNGGQQFYAILNGIKQNSQPQTNVYIAGIKNGGYSLKIIFSDGKTADVDKNLMIDAPMDITTRIIFKKGKGKLQLIGMEPISNQKPAENLVVYRPSNSAVYSDAVVITSANTNVNQQNGTIQTQVNSSNGQINSNEQINVNTNVNSNQTQSTNGQINMNTNVTNTQTHSNSEQINMNVGTNVNGSQTGMNTSIQVTETQTSTTNSNPNMQGENVNINMNVNVQDPTMTGQGGANISINMSGTGTGTGHQTQQETYQQTTTITTTGGTQTNTNVNTNQNQNQVNSQENNQVNTQTNVNNTSTNASTAVTCKNILGNEKAIVDDLKSMTFDEDKKEIVIKDLANHCLTASQAYKIIEVFTFEADRLELAKYLYNRMIDKDSAKNLLPLFTFDATKMEFREYIRK